MTPDIIFSNVVLPSLLTALLLLLAWRPWNRAAQPTRLQFLLSAAATSLPWIIPAGNRANAFHPSLWIFTPWTPGDSSRWFLLFALAVSSLSLFLALLTPRPTLTDSTIHPLSHSSHNLRAALLSALTFLLIFALGSLTAWLLLHNQLARVPLDGDTDAEILALATRQTSIRLCIIAIPLIAASWSLIADRLNARGRSILVPAILSTIALASTIIIFMCGSATLMLLMAALAGIMIAATVLAMISPAATFPPGHTAAFFLIWSTILVFTRFNQSQLLPDYFWLLLLTPASLLAALHPAIWSLRPLLRFLTVAALTLLPPLLILWQLFPSWQQKMAGATG